jgi:hypothetical protein
MLLAASLFSAGTLPVWETLIQVIAQNWPPSGPDPGRTHVDPCHFLATRTAALSAEKEKAPR